MRHSRHEGLAPVRLSIGLETGSGSFAGEFLPDIGSIGLSFSLVFGLFVCGRGVLFALIRLRGRRGRTKRRPSVRDLKNGASPSPRSKRPEDLEMTVETTLKPGRMGGADEAPRPPSGREGAQRRKKGPGGPRNALIRLDSAKEKQGFSLL